MCFYPIMYNRPAVVDLDGVSFETVAYALASDPGFIAIDARAAVGADGRFSLIAANPTHAFSFSGSFVTQDGHTAIDTPRTALEIFFTKLGNFTADPYLPFSGGVIGYVGFEGARTLHGLEPASGFSRFPQCRFGLYPTIVLFDRCEGTSFIVSQRETRKETQILADRLMAAPQRGMPRNQTLPHNAGEVRRNPDDTEFARIADVAHTWIRADLLASLHLVRHTTSVLPSLAPLDLFLAGQAADATRMFLLHESAAAVLTSRAPATRRTGYRDAVRTLLELVPAAELTGTPLPQALSFLCEHEQVHRGFYGGACATIDGNGLAVRLVHGVHIHADGAFGATTGIDLGAPLNVPSTFGELRET